MEARMSKMEQMDLTVTELRSILDSEAECSLIDVREYPEYAAGRISQAQLI